MKANELRIGNWVQVEYDYETITAIEELRARCCLLEKISKDRGVWQDYIHIKPIKLTEDWLLKFGFEKYGNEWRLFPCAEIQIIIFNENNYYGVMFYTRTIHTDYVRV